MLSKFTSLQTLKNYNKEKINKKEKKWRKTIYKYKINMKKSIIK